MQFDILFTGHFSLPLGRESMNEMHCDDEIWLINTYFEDFFGVKVGE